MSTLRKTIVVFFSVLVVAACAYFALAANEPTAPMVIERGADSTFDPANWAPIEVNATGGNITWLTITGLTQTRAWQGYWGNVSGYITLDDASNQTFYNWSAAEPRGQVYATLVSAGSVSWPDVNCVDFATQAADFDTFYGIQQDDYDNVTITYNLTDHPTFQIVHRDITTCPTTYIWQSDSYQASNFVNVLMYDSVEATANQSWVFATIMENNETSNKTDLPCYNGQDCDFQLLVAEDEHTVAGPTPYYFWVDITG